MATQTENIIAVELFSNMVNSLESKLTSRTSLKHDVKYNLNELNLAFANDFKQIQEVLQSVVDSYYLGYYNVSGFEFFSIENFEYCIKHNLELVNNAKKLIKFIN